MKIVSLLLVLTFKSSSEYLNKPFKMKFEFNFLFHNPMRLMVQNSGKVHDKSLSKRMVQVEVLLRALDIRRSKLSALVQLLFDLVFGVVVKQTPQKGFFAAFNYFLFEASVVIHSLTLTFSHTKRMTTLCLVLISKNIDSLLLLLNDIFFLPTHYSLIQMIRLD